MQERAFPRLTNSKHFPGALAPNALPVDVPNTKDAQPPNVETALLRP